MIHMGIKWESDVMLTVDGMLTVCGVLTVSGMLTVQRGLPMDSVSTSPEQSPDTRSKPKSKRYERQTVLLANGTRD